MSACKLYLYVTMIVPFILISFWERLWIWLDRQDTYLFLKINNDWHNSFLDSVYPWWREANTWIPLYLFLIIFLGMNVGKKAGWWILFAVITVVLTDQISAHLIKNLVMRPRPCQDSVLAYHVRLLLSNCSGGFSFPSSHATNHFGFAVFIFLTLKNIIGRWRFAFLFWAASIAYGQVYVGVHYPLDVVCGSVLGIFIGFSTAYIFNHIFEELQLFHKQPKQI